MMGTWYDRLYDAIMGPWIRFRYEWCASHHREHHIVTRPVGRSLERVHCTKCNASRLRYKK